MNFLSSLSAAYIAFAFGILTASASFFESHFSAPMVAGVAIAFGIVLSVASLYVHQQAD